MSYAGVSACLSYLSILREKLEPFYFGTPGQPLFGCYHAPTAGPTRECGVVLCYPMGEEYIRFHRAFRQLAERLSRVGFPALRFDFYGCGDSAGDDEAGRLAQWLTDVSTAIHEIRRRSHVEKVCLIGLRLGGALSALVGVNRQDVDEMVLWDPVVRGQQYLEELRRLHRDMLGRAHVKPRPHRASEKQAELLGFPVTDSMLTEIESLDLLAISQKPASNILLIESHDRVDQGRFLKHLKSLGVQVTYQPMPLPQLWTWSEDVSKILVPHQILQSVVAWISEVEP